MTVNRLPSMQEFVRAGAGVGIMPAGAYAAGPRRSATRAIRVTGLAASIGLVTRRDSPAPAHVAGLIEAIREQAARATD